MRDAMCLLDATRMHQLMYLTLLCTCSLLPFCCICAGQVCLFDCIEWLREQLQQWQDQAAAELTEAAERLGLGSSDDDDAAESDEDWDPELQQLPEASTSQVCLATLLSF
jgi:hypothetical protein